MGAFFALDRSLFSSVGYPESFRDACAGLIRGSLVQVQKGERRKTSVNSEVFRILELYIQTSYLEVINSIHMYFSGSVTYFFENYISKREKDGQNTVHSLKWTP